MLIAKKNLLIIKNYKEIKILSSKLIVVTMKDYSYKIKGENIAMTYYDRYEVRINGLINVIIYGV